MSEIKELKARAYDLINIMERAKAELDAVNRKILELMQGEKKDEHNE